MTNQPQNAKALKKPAFITGIAYVYALTLWSMIKTFDTPLVNRAPLYLGSWASPHLQWDYYTIATLIVAFVTIGLFLGHGWPRWLALAGTVAGWAVSLPLHDTRGIGLYTVSVAAGAIVLGLLFLAPSARAYFSRKSQANVSPSMRLRARAFVATLFYVVGALAIYSAVLDGFVHIGKLWLTFAAILVISLPCLLLGMVARGNIASAYRDSATVLIATALASLLAVFASVVFIHSTRPASLALVDFSQPIVAAGIALIGYLLARVSKRRASNVTASFS